MRRSSGYRRGIAVVATAALGLTACVTVPTNGAPRPLRTFEPRVSNQVIAGPTEGIEPAELVREFYAASVHPTSDYSAARAYLTKAASDAWSPTTDTVVVDDLAVSTQTASDSATRTLKVNGKIVGRLRTGGSFIPEDLGYEVSLDVTQDNGQWRIASLPNEVVVEKRELRNHYEPHELYFFDQSSRVLVADRRWMYRDEQYQETVLVSLLMEGPSSSLAPATADIVPPGSTFTGKVDGVLTFTGFQSLDQTARMKFGAQVVLTLANSGIAQPYRISLDGLPLSPETPELAPEDFANFNPQVAAAAASADIYALSGGEIFQVTEDQETVMRRVVSGSTLEGFDVSATGGVVATEQRRDGKYRLLAGNTQAGLQEAYRAETLLPPSFDSVGGNAWTVADGSTFVRVVKPASGDDYVTTAVEADEVIKKLRDDGGLSEDEEPVVSAVAVSRTGVRLAFVVDGHLYLAVVSQLDSGRLSLLNPQRMYINTNGQISSVAWNPDDSLLVGTNSPQSPVLRVEMDGSISRTVSANNISVPVSGVAATTTTMYATDTAAVRQLSVDDLSTTATWEEMKGLQGTRAKVAVAD